ncbi:hypothetical protein, partial [Psychromonas aquatilis]
SASLDNVNNKRNNFVVTLLHFSSMNFVMVFWFDASRETEVTAPKDRLQTRRTKVNAPKTGYQTRETEVTAPDIAFVLCCMQ